MFLVFLLINREKKTTKTMMNCLPTVEVSSPLALVASVLICAVLDTACFLVSTTSGITASIKDNDSITFSEPSYNEEEKKKITDYGWLRSPRQKWFCDFCPMTAGETSQANPSKAVLLKRL